MGAQAKDGGAEGCVGCSFTVFGLVSWQSLLRRVVDRSLRIAALGFLIALFGAALGLFASSVGLSWLGVVAAIIIVAGSAIAVFDISADQPYGLGAVQMAASAAVK